MAVSRKGRDALRLTMSERDAIALAAVRKALARIVRLLILHRGCVGHAECPLMWRERVSVTERHRDDFRRTSADFPDFGAPIFFEAYAASLLATRS
jgi:hypothetical protein